MNVTRKQVFSYMVMPQILPRLRDLFARGFQYMPYFIALVYGAVRLLPAHHPYLDPANMGRFGIRHVVAEAANNLTLSFKNLDQIILFLSVLAGMAMVFVQLVLFGVVLFIQPVLAGTFADFFVTPAANEPFDLAHIMLDMVFGVPGVFNSCVSTGVACLDGEGNPINSSAAGVSWGYAPSNFPMAMHLGLHSVFQIYSFGLLYIAVMLFVYMITTVLAETMQSGTAFGRRYNHVWAPIRMVVAFGLLMPIGFGLNSAQYIVLYAAKYGSAFATNGWTTFNATLSGAFGGAYQNLAADVDAAATNMVAAPEIPEIRHLLQFLYTAKACAYGQAYLNEDLHASGNGVQMYLVKDPLAATNHFPVGDNGTAPTYAQMINFANGERVIKIRIGHRDPEKNSTHLGYVKPTCGELTLRLPDPRTVADQEVGVRIMQELYFAMIRDMYHRAAPMMTDHFVDRNVKTASYDPNLPKPASTLVNALIFTYTASINDALNGPGTSAFVAPNVTAAIPPGGAVEAMTQSGRFNVDAALIQKGWAGAAIWYNRVAEMNGAVSTAALNIPTITRYPAIMEEVYALKRKSKGTVNFKERFNPKSGIAGSLNLKEAKNVPFADALWESYNYWQAGDVGTSPHSRATGNMFQDILNALIGTDGLFSVRDNLNVHPLAQLSAVGKSLIQSSMRNISGAAVVAGATPIATMFGQLSGESAKMFGSAIVSLTMVAITAGFVLFYIVPFLPFIYFSFAFGGWVKGIFEAMVGAPLWALAHIRIDGNGLSGQAALSGYFLIFEIFLRPILMIAGLLASISTFSALVWVLNITFDLVVSNVGGFDIAEEMAGATAGLRIQDMRNVVDEFFFTVLYVIIVYLMGMSSFKMIDLVPNNILRWMGQSITTFNDSQENAAETLAGRATQGAQQTSQAIGGGLQGLFK